MVLASGGSGVVGVVVLVVIVAIVLYAQLGAVFSRQYRRDQEPIEQWNDSDPTG